MRHPSSDPPEQGIALVAVEGIRDSRAAGNEQVLGTPPLRKDSRFVDGERDPSALRTAPVRPRLGRRTPFVRLVSAPGCAFQALGLAWSSAHINRIIYYPVSPANRGPASGRLPQPVPTILWMSLKNPDLAAAVAMGSALVAELAVYLATDESLLGMLPGWLGPVVLAVAAFARWRLARPVPPVEVQASPIGEAAVASAHRSSELAPIAIPAHVDPDATPVISLED